MSAGLFSPLVQYRTFHSLLQQCKQLSRVRGREPRREVLGDAAENSVR